MVAPHITDGFQIGMVQILVPTLQITEFFSYYVIYRLGQFQEIIVKRSCFVHHGFQIATTYRSWCQQYKSLHTSFTMLYASFVSFRKLQLNMVALYITNGFQIEMVLTLYINAFFSYYVMYRRGQFQEIVVNHGSFVHYQWFSDLNGTYYATQIMVPRPQITTFFSYYVISLPPRPFGGNLN